MLRRAGLEPYVPLLSRKVPVDIAYGGAFYCFVSSDDIGIDLELGKVKKVIDIAQAITDATKAMVCFCFVYAKSFTIILH